MHRGGEILTVQFGPFANFCGTHYWNLHDESLHNSNSEKPFYRVNAFFRAGETHGISRGYTPRLLIYDHHGNFGSLNKFGTTQSATGALTASATNRVQRIEKDGPKKHEFVKLAEAQTEPLQETPKRFDFDRTVTYWSDFLNVDVNSKTVHEVPPVEEWAPNRDRFALGHLALRTTDAKDEALDSVRYYTEECGLLEGFQIVVDFSSPSFSAFAADYITELRDEYPKREILLFSVSPSQAAPQTREALTSRIAGEALSLHALAEHASLYVPLSLTSAANLPHLRGNWNKPYHTSAILATAMEVLTSPCRLLDAETTLTGLSNALHRGSNRNLASAFLSMPLPQLQRFFAESNYSAIRQQFMQSLNPYYEYSQPYLNYGHFAVLKGIDESLWKSRGTPVKPSGQTQSLDQWFSDIVSASGSKLCLVDRPVDLPITYPQFFGSEVGKNGLLASGDSTADVHSIPVFASLENNDAIFAGLSKFVNTFTALDRQMVFQTQAPDMNRDEYNELVNQLLTLAEQYES